MVTLSFVKQVGKISKKIKITVTTDPEKALLSAAYDESVLGGKTLELINVETVNDSNAFVRSMIFGIGGDSKQQNITEDGVFPTFFMASRCYKFLIVTNTTDKVCQLSGGTTLGATNLFAGATIAANGYTSIPLNGLTPTVITAFFLHSGGVDDNWNDANLDIKTTSDPI
jgi:hypothetical protein